MHNWGDDLPIQPGSLKRQCVSCGRDEYVDELRLCTGCREVHNEEMAADARERAEADADATHAYYGA